MSIISRIKDLLTGKKKNTSASTGKSLTFGARAVRNNASGYRSGGSTAYYRSEEDEKAKQRERLKEQQIKATQTLADIAKRTDALSSGQKPNVTTTSTTSKPSNGIDKVVAKIGEKSKSVPPDPKETARKSAQERAKANQKKLAEALQARTSEEMIATGDWQRAEAPRNINTPSADNRPSTVMSRQGLEKMYSSKGMPALTTVARRLPTGYSFGMLRPLLKGYSDSPYDQMQEEVYREHEMPILGGAAEFAGSMLAFSQTAGATDALGSKIMGKIAPNAAEKIAGSAIGRRVATGIAERRLGAEATEQLINSIGKKKAEQLINRFGGEVIQNLTTGAIYDVADASAEHEMFSPEWWADIGQRAKFNAELTGLLVAIPFFGGGNKRIVRDVLNVVEGQPKNLMRSAQAASDMMDNASGEGRINILDLARRKADDVATGRNVEEIDRELDTIYNNIARNGDMPEEELSTLVKRANSLKAERAALEGSANVVETARPVVENLDEVRNVEPPRINEVVEPPRMEAETPEAPRPEPKAEEPKAEAPKAKPQEQSSGYARRKELDKEMRALEKEKDEIVKGWKEKYGDANPRNYGELPKEERAVFDEQKRRVREIHERIKALREEFHQSLKAESPEAESLEAKPLENVADTTRAQREAELKSIEEEYNALKKRISDAEKRGELYDGYEDDLKTIDELAYERDNLRNELGTQAQERKVRSDKGTTRAKPTETVEETAETVKAEAQTEAPKYEEAEASAERAAEGEPTAKTSVDEHSAENTAEQAEKTAEAEKNAEPVNGREKKSPPIKETKTKQKKRLERSKIDQKYERAHEKLGEKVRSESGNKKNVRAGARVAEVIGSDENAKEFLYQAERRLKGIEDEASAAGFRIEYTRESGVDRAARIRKSYDRLDKLGAKKVVDELKGFLKSDRPLAEQDIADVIVLENYYDLLGKKMPKSYERVCNEIVLRQRTESGQLVNSVHLLLKEHSPRYRRKYIDAGFEKFRETICRQDNWDDIKRSLNKNHEEFLEKNAKWFEEKGIEADWLEYQLDRLAHFEGTEAEYRRELSRLQNQIFRNSKPSNWDVLNMIRYSAMLSKPATALRNIYGNTSQRLMYNISDKINNVIEVGLEKQNKSQRAALTKQIEATEGKLKALKKGSKEYKKVSEELANLKSELAGKEKFERTTTILKDKNDILWTQELTEGKIGGKEKLEKKIIKATEDLGKMDEGSAEYKELKSQIDEMEESLKTGNKSKTRFKSLDENKYYAKLREFLADDHPQMMGEPKYGQKSQRGADYVYEKGGWVKKKLAKAGELGGKYTDITLNEPDSWFVERNYRSALLKYLKANGIDSIEKIEANPEVVQRARQHAMEVARENTYKRNYQLVNFLERARQKGYAKNSKLYNKAFTLALDAESPFLKVPVNMIVNNFKYNPISIATNLKKAVSASKHNDVRAMQEACRELSKSLTGTGIAALGYFMSVDEQGDEGKGLIAHAKDELKPYGIRDYSLQWDNKNMALSDVGIGVPQLMMGVSLAEEHNQQGGLPSNAFTLEDIVNAFGMTVDVPTEQSLLDNVMDLIDAAGEGYDYGKGTFDRALGVSEKVVTDYVGQPLPTWLRGVAGGMTSSDLDTNVKKGDTTNIERQFKRNANNLISAIPVVNEKVLPHKVDVHGNYVNERKTTGAKLKQIGINTFDPLSTKTVRIPEADKFELAAKNDKGEGYVPDAFDKDRTYQAKIGRGDTAEIFDLTGKEREQAAHSVQDSGKDMANAVVYAKPAYFGDSHGARAQQILRECPENQEEARAYLYSQPEIQKLSDSEKRKFFDVVYHGYGGDEKHLGRDRASNHSVYVDINGGSEEDFRFMNDLSETEQSYYNNAELASRGISKGTYADAIDAIHYAAHKFKNGQNLDDTKGKKTTIAGILSLGLSPEENIAIYEAYRGKNNWKDWDGISGVSAGNGWRRYGRYRRHGRGGSSAKAKVPAPKKIAASSLKKGEALVDKKRSSSKYEEYPTLKRVKAKIDLPTAKR